MFMGTFIVNRHINLDIVPLSSPYLRICFLAFVSLFFIDLKIIYYLGYIYNPNEDVQACHFERSIWIKPHLKIKYFALQLFKRINKPSLHFGVKT